MNYSKRHKWVASVFNHFPNINQQDVLEHPENYLGPNYKEVLNLWFYWYSLSSEQWDVYWKRWCSLNSETRTKARSTTTELPKEVIDSRFVYYILDLALELIASYLYIGRGIPFTYLPYLLKTNTSISIVNISWA
jgi:hypothetical protein